MAVKIKIMAGGNEFLGELNDSITGKAIAEALPIRAAGQRWGGEIYFSIGVEMGLEDGSRCVVSAGELGYWPSGSAFCIFFGVTPASQGDEIRAASAVNIVGEVFGDISGLWEVESGAEILIERC